MKLALSETRSRTVPMTKIEMGAVEVRDDGSRGLSLSGHAAVFKSRSENLGGFTESIAVGAFRNIVNQDVVLTINHDSNLVLARSKSGTLTLKQDPRGLHVTARPADTTYARDLNAVMARGDVDKMSFMFAEPVVRDKWEEGEDGIPHRTVLEFGRIFDVAVVTYPAYRQTDAAMGGRMVEIEVPGPAVEPAVEAVDEEGVHAEMRRRLALARARGCSGSVAR